MRRRAHLCLFAALAALAACTRSSLDLSGDASPSPSGTLTPTPTPTTTTTPAIGYGDGRDGTVSLTSTSIVSECMPLNSAKNSTITASSGPLAAQPGDVFLILQVQDAVGSSGDASPFAALGDAGKWEIAAVQGGATGTAYTTVSPLVNSYDSLGTRRAQACKMRQYVDLTTQVGATIGPSDWDGSSGGVFAVLVQNAMQIDGVITATGRGFRGGAIGSSASCTTSISLDAVAASDGGTKGEGLDGRSFAKFGRGNYANAGGGGNSCAAGGGGGGNGGAGGKGGKQVQSSGNEPLTQGLGGAALTVSGRLLFGGGGGAGHGGGPGAGGDGGGIVLIIARSLAGTQNVRSDGLPGGNGTLSGNFSGGGGGGAGGTVALYYSISSWSGQIHSEGAPGGNAPGGGGLEMGAGGGGAGGRFFNGGTAVFPTIFTGGAAGTNTNASTNGATDGAPGIAE